MQNKISGIFKIQLPFGDMDPTIAVFNESRSVHGLIPMDPTILRLFPNPAVHHIHVMGQYDEATCNIHIDTIIPDQGW